MYISGTGEWRSHLTPEEHEELNTHQQIAQELDNLDHQSMKVFLGFITFWIFLGLAFAGWLYVYLIPAVKGWF